MTEQKMNKAKKIKIIVAIILSIITLMGVTVLSMSLIKTSHIMELNRPDKIIVYYNSTSNNIVFEPSDSEYQTIYKMVNNAHKQSILTSIFNGQIFKDVDLIEHGLQKINFDGIKISFVYSTPQIAKLKDEIHPSNIWYRSLIFNISSENEFNYHSTAIMSPENNNVGDFTYTSHYMTYSNFNNLYNYLNTIFN